MKSGTIVIAYCSCIAGYTILFGGMDCVSMYECVLCMYVATFVCNPSDMTVTNFYLQAQPDGTKAFKQPHEYYCQV